MARRSALTPQQLVELRQAMVMRQALTDKALARRFEVSVFAIQYAAKVIRLSLPKRRGGGDE